MELTDSIIKQLLNDESDSPKISIYTPTHPKSTSQSINEDQIRFKNALQSIENDPAIADGELASSYAKLVELLDDTDFWLHQSVSLAVFADKDEVQTIRLNYELTPSAHVSNHYMVSPLLALDDIDSAYYLLDINLKQPQLYTGTSHGLKPIKEDGILGPIEEVVDTDDRKGTLDFRSGDMGGHAMFYGGSNERVDNDTALYLKLLAEAADEHLVDQSMPLLLVGTDNRVAEIRSLLNYKNILDQELHIDRDSTSEPELHTAAEEIVAKLAHDRRAEKVAAYQATDFESRVDGLTAISVAAEEGRVDRVYLPLIRITTDSVDQSSPESPLVELPENFQEFDKVIRAVAKQGGQVVTVEQADFAEDPTPKALLRY